MSTDFFYQAHLNNWQSYLAALGNEIELAAWDLVALTAANCKQAEAYRYQLDLRRELGLLAWGMVLGRPVLAGAAMGATTWAMGYLNRPLALLVSLIVYALALKLLRVLTAEEIGQLSSLLPPGVRRVVGTPATGEAASR